MTEEVIDLISPTTIPVSNKMASALEDVKEGLGNWPLWVLLSWQDIRLRYRRSQLGPFWITISMAISISMMGLLYGHLFRLQIHTYFPYLAAGMLTWSLMSLLITDGTHTFIEAENYLKQMKLPYSIFILRVVSRSIIIFLHNLVVLIPIYFIFHIHLSWATLMVIPAFFLICANAFIYCMILAIVGARFRDLGQLISSMIQIIFFATPIMWSENILPESYRFLILLNPFAQFIELLRAPLISTMPTLYSVCAVLFFTVIGISLMLYLLARVRHRIIFWL